MRQARLILAIAIAIALGSPLVLAQTATAPVVDGVHAPRQPPAATAQDAKAARKPVSAIGRALAVLLQDANRQPAPATPRHIGNTADADARHDVEAVHRTQLVAQDEHDRSPG